MAIACAALAGCSDDDPEGSLGQCPPGASYDDDKERCVSGNSQLGPDADASSGENDTGGHWHDTSPPDDGGTNDVDAESPQCPQDQCGDDCVDLSSSADHCGYCDQPCEAPRTCQDGHCECPGDDELCADQCVDVTASDDHCGSCGNACSGGENCVEGQCHPDEKVGGIIHYMNEARSTESDCGQYGTFSPVGPVEGHPLLHEAAQGHADDMAENDFFSHTGSDGSSFSQRISATGYTGTPVGENIAAGDHDPAIVIQRWLDSDGHCRNLMQGSANQVGVGFSLGGPWGSFWVLKLASGF